MVEDKGPTLEYASELFVRDCVARGLAPGTVEDYEKALKYFRAELKDVAYVKDLNVNILSLFRTQRKVKPSTLGREIRIIRGFLNFCVDQNWRVDNPAYKIKPPKSRRRPTLPFTDDEVRALVAACDRMENPFEDQQERSRLRSRALVLLMLATGFRISDVVGLRRDRVDKDGRLLVRIEKTGHPLYTRLDPVCLAALHALPVESPYFLWSGKGQKRVASTSLRRTTYLLGELAGVHNVHPHRFRDTFAVRLLRAGVKIEMVSKLLGHANITITQKYYAPWVPELQNELDAVLEKLTSTPLY